MYRPSLYKLILAALVLMAFLARTMDGFLIVLDYYTHTAEYAKYCVNKDNPAMHCNGQCQMFKKINTQEKKDQQSPQRKSDDKNDISYSSKSYFACACRPRMVLIKAIMFRDFSWPAITKKTSSIFHPPQGGPSLI